MAKYLTQEWLDMGRKLAESQPERPGASARMQYVITGGPDGDGWSEDSSLLKKPSLADDRSS